MEESDELGSGGFGIVYLARHRDRAPETLHRWRKSLQSHCSNRADSRDRHESRRLLVLPCARAHVLLQFVDLRIKVDDLIK